VDIIIPSKISVRVRDGTRTRGPQDHNLVL
jgi:hypothetical protein